MDRCISEAERMLEIESGILRRAEARSCCFGDDLSLQLYGSVKTLENMLHKLRSGNISEAISSLNEYEQSISAKEGFHGGG
ncbi:MAG: hypothetical protein R6U89_11485 [Dehalococcoidia bacterium]